MCTLIMHANFCGHKAPQRPRKSAIQDHACNASVFGQALWDFHDPAFFMRRCEAMPEPGLLKI